MSCLASLLTPTVTSPLRLLIKVASNLMHVAAQKELGITVADDFLPLVEWIAVLHLGQILKDTGNAEIPASDYTDFLIQFQDSPGVGKLISQYMYSNR